MDSAELKHKTFHAVWWALVNVGTANVLTFIVFTVLARVLTPRDFGLFALAILVADIGRIVSGAGLSDAIIRDTDRDAVLADTVFWANLGLGCIVGGVLWALSPLYASMVRQPEVTPVLRALAILVPISCLSSIHTARKLQEFGHRAVAVRMMCGSVLGGGTAVAAAILGLGIWSFVIQTGVVDAIGIIFAWQTYPWCPRLRFDLRRLRAVSGFSSMMMMTQILGLLLTRIQDMVIGRYLSAAAVGTYRIAWRMIDMITQTTVQPMVGVSFVTFSQLKDDETRFRFAFLRMLGLGALITFPAIGGFAVLSDEIIGLLFGAKWQASAAIAKILALMAIPFCMNLLTGPALAAIGRSRTLAKGALVQTAATLGFTMAAVPFGLSWVAAAYVLRAYLTMPYHLTLFRRDTGIGFISMARTILPPLLSSLAMVVLLSLLAPYLRAFLGRGVAYLAAAFLLGSMLYGGTLLAFGMNYIRSNLEAFQPLWKGHRQPVMAR
jgi:O-antigen/teichoic acid export membrane protein